jgi:hypothetical protein
MNVFEKGVHPRQFYLVAIVDARTHGKGTPSGVLDSETAEHLND